MPQPTFKLSTRTSFYPNAVKLGIRPKEQKTVTKIAAFIRRRARTLTGRATVKSAPEGASPRMHQKELHDLINFAVDTATNIAVIGPEKFTEAKKTTIVANNGGDTVPALLESGGEETFTMKRGKRRTRRYAGNPFMQPSLKDAMANDNLKAAWSDVQVEI